MHWSADERASALVLAPPAQARRYRRSSGPPRSWRRCTRKSPASRRRPRRAGPRDAHYLRCSLAHPRRPLRLWRPTRWPLQEIPALSPSCRRRSRQAFQPSRSRRFRRGTAAPYLCRRAVLVCTFGTKVTLRLPPSTLVTTKVNGRFL
jgi:hypothetical protein